MAFVGLIIGVPALVRNRSQAIIQEKLPQKDAFNFLSFHALDESNKIAMELQAFSMFASDRVVFVPPPGVQTDERPGFRFGRRAVPVNGDQDDCQSQRRDGVAREG